MIDCLTTRPAQRSGQPVLPHGRDHSRGCEGGIREGRRSVRRKRRSLPGHLRQPVKPDLLERQLFEQFKDIFGLSPEENKRALDEGYRALRYFDNVTMRGAAREVLEKLEREDRIGVVLLGRPYHNDPA